MKRRYYFIIFVILFGLSLYGIIHALVSNDPEINQNPAPVNTTIPEVPAPAPTQPTSDLITVTAPVSGQTITSPFTVTGKARGNWYFEGSFPVILTDQNGTVIASTPASAQGDWMTTDYVPFKAVLSFTVPANTTGVPRIGYLTLKKDNPSGDPQFDNSVIIKVQW